MSERECWERERLELDEMMPEGGDNAVNKE